MRETTVLATAHTPGSLSRTAGTFLRAAATLETDVLATASTAIAPDCPPPTVPGHGLTLRMGARPAGRNLAKRPGLP